MKSLSEYLNSKGKTLEKPEEKVVAGDVEGDCNDNDKNPKLKNIDKKGKSGVLQVKENMTDLVDAVQIFQAARDIAAEHPRYMERLVREFKNNGVLASLMAELMMHRETYSYIAELMGNKVYGEQISKNLARAMFSEDVAPPFHHAHDDESLEDDDDSMGDDGMNPDDGMDDMGGDDLDDMNDDGGEEMGHDDLDGDSEGDDMGGDDDMSQYADPDLDPSMGGGEDDLGGEGGLDHPGNAVPKMRRPMPHSFENFNKAIGKIFGETIKK